MFSFKRKLSPVLKDALSSNLYNSYRVIIQYRSLKDGLEKKIKSFRGEYLFSIVSINCMVAILNSSAIKRLLEFPEVKYMMLDDYAFLCGRNVLYSNGISLQSNNSILKGNYNLSGRGVGIGIVDSGTYPHSDLTHSNNKIKKFVDLLKGHTYPYDDNGHGTFITGLICGSGYESKGKNKGIAENSHVVMVKAFDNIGKSYISTTLLAIENLIDSSEEFNIKIICLPFETYDISKRVLALYSKLFKKAISNGMIVVVPSGHNGNREDSIRGIATLKEVITVGGMDTTIGNKIYDFSSCGSSRALSKPDFVAACVNVTSLNTDINYVSERDGMKLYPSKLKHSYVDYTGTSIGCGFIAGVCALLYEYNNDLKFEDIYGLLKISSKFLKEKKYMQGNGYINLDNILPQKT